MVFSFRDKRIYTDGNFQHVVQLPPVKDLLFNEEMVDVGDRAVDDTSRFCISKYPTVLDTSQEYRVASGTGMCVSTILQMACDSGSATVQLGAEDSSDTFDPVNDEFRFTVCLRRESLLNYAVCYLAALTTDGPVNFNDINRFDYIRLYQYFSLLEAMCFLNRIIIDRNANLVDVRMFLLTLGDSRINLPLYPLNILIMLLNDGMQVTYDGRISQHGAGTSKEKSMCEINTRVTTDLSNGDIVQIFREALGTVRQGNLKLLDTLFTMFVDRQIVNYAIVYEQLDGISVQQANNLCRFAGTFRATYSATTALDEMLRVNNNWLKNLIRMTSRNGLWINMPIRNLISKQISIDYSFLFVAFTYGASVYRSKFVTDFTAVSFNAAYNVQLDALNSTVLDFTHKVVTQDNYERWTYSVISDIMWSIAFFGFEQKFTVIQLSKSSSNQNVQTPIIATPNRSPIARAQARGLRLVTSTKAMGNDTYQPHNETLNVLQWTDNLPEVYKVALVKQDSKAIIAKQEIAEQQKVVQLDPINVNKYNDIIQFEEQFNNHENFEDTKESLKWYTNIKSDSVKDLILKVSEIRNIVVIYKKIDLKSKDFELMAKTFISKRDVIFDKFRKEFGVDIIVITAEPLTGKSRLCSEYGDIFRDIDDLLESWSLHVSQEFPTMNELGGKDTAKGILLGKIGKDLGNRILLTHHVNDVIKSGLKYINLGHLTLKDELIVPILKQREPEADQLRLNWLCSIRDEYIPNRLMGDHNDFRKYLYYLMSYLVKHLDDQTEKVIDKSEIASEVKNL